jgi:apolipoprotein N-acyltransferase
MIRRSDTAMLSGPASGAVLVLAGMLLCLSNGRSVTSLAPWWALVFMLRFVRGRGVILGLAAGLLVSVLATLIVWRGMIPVPRGPYTVIAAGMGALFFLPFAVDRVLTPRISGFAATFVLPLAFVTTELFTALLSPYGSWGSLAYTQYDNLPLIQIVSVTGTAGVVFLMAWCAAVVNWAWEHRFSWKRVGFEFTIVIAVVSLVLLFGGVRLAARPRNATTVRVAGITVRPGDAMRITRLLDPDHTPDELKTVRAASAVLLDTLFKRSEREVRAGAGIVAWSEVNGLVVKEDEPALIARAREFAARNGVYLFMPLGTATPGSPRYENQLVAIDPDGQVVFRYHKARPVPGDLEMGADRSIPKPVAGPAGGRVAGAICFDMDFPQLIHRAGRLRADILIAPSSDWLEIDPMHTRMAIFRGIENGFAVVRPTNKGLSAAADCQGRILAAADYFASSDHRIVAQVPTLGARTFYAAVGDLFAWLCVVALAGLAVLAQGFRRPL